jgi:hypothetical protein
MRTLHISLRVRTGSFILTLGSHWACWLGLSKAVPISQLPVYLAKPSCAPTLAHTQPFPRPCLQPLAMIAASFGFQLIASWQVVVAVLQFVIVIPDHALKCRALTADGGAQQLRYDELLQVKGLGGAGEEAVRGVTG